MLIYVDYFKERERERLKGLVICFCGYYQRVSHD